MKGSNRKKILALSCILVLIIAVTSGCASGRLNREKVTIWSAAEDYRNEYYLAQCQKRFPDYDINLEYMNSSTIAAKVTEEGDDCSCDIILSEEYGYLDKCEPYLLELTEFDFSPFLDDIVPESRKYSPEMKNGGCIIVNPKILEEHQLPVPTSYEDLLNPEYEGLISMPSPLSSGTGYAFLRQLTNEWGEDEAFDYFEKLSENVLQYTSSGSGPINALIQGEVAVGLGTIYQAATEISQGMDIQIVFFPEGAPFSMYGNAVLSKSSNRSCVMEVFQYLSTDLCKENNKNFCPDQIFKEFVPEMGGYPQNIPYGDMSNDTLAEKERLQAKWSFN